MRKTESLYYRTAALAIACLLLTCVALVGWVGGIGLPLGDAGAEGEETRNLWGALAIAAIGSVLSALAMKRALRPLAAFLAAHVVREEDEPQRGEVAQLTSLYAEQKEEIHALEREAKRFARDASRTIQAPLQRIMDAIGTEDIETVRSEAKRLMQIAEDMRLLDASYEATEVTTFLLSEMLADILPGLRAVMAEKDVELRLAGETRLTGHRTQLTKAFENLLDNAIRYNVPGGRVYVTGTKGGVSIADTGIGVDTARLSTVFMPFCSGADEETEAVAYAAKGGSGLGLAVSRHVFAQHGMRVAISSDSGTTVTVYLREK